MDRSLGIAAQKRGGAVRAFALVIKRGVLYENLAQKAEQAQAFRKKPLFVAAAI